MALDYDKAVAAQVIGGTWGGISYGTPDVPEELRATIYSAITRQVATMYAAGQLASEDRTRILTAAKGGIFLFPALTEKMAGDELLKVGFYRMMNDSGYWSLKKTVLSQLKKAAEDSAMSAAKKAAVWNAVSESMQWISGSKAKDMLNAKITEIAVAVRQAQALNAEAKAKLSPSRYALVKDALGKIGPKITYLETVLPGVGDEVGWKGMGALPVVVIVIGAAIVVVAAVAAYITTILSNAVGVYSTQIEAQRQEEVAAAKAKAEAEARAAEAEAAATKAAIDAAQREGEITAAQAAAQKAAADAKAAATKAGIKEKESAAIIDAGQRSQEARKEAGGSIITPILEGAGQGVAAMITPVAIVGGVVLGAYLLLPKLLKRGN